MWFEARICPDSGCVLGLADEVYNWDRNPWCQKFGDAPAASTLTIDAQDWICFDMAETATIKNLTILGMLFFDDSVKEWCLSEAHRTWFHQRVV